MGMRSILVVLQAITLVKSEISRFDNGFSASFEIINIGRMYKTMKPTLHLNVYACAVECIHHLGCVTINHNDKKDLCELVDQKYDETEADTSNPDWANYGTPDKVDGNFSAWKKDSICSQTCGNGTQIERRSCDNPQPRFGGKPCQGKTVRKVKCTTNVPCPTGDGSWSAWTANGFCSSCTELTRTCDTPPQIKHKDFSCLQSDKVTRGMKESKPCKPCNISDYVKCEFKKNLNIPTENFEYLPSAPSEEHCTEFCYGKKRNKPQIAAAVMDKRNNYCYCKARKSANENDQYKGCFFEEVNLVHLRSASQSSTHYEGGMERAASLAVDGTNRWSSTKNETLPWWSVEADSLFLLQKMIIKFSQNWDLYKKDIVVKVKTAQNKPWEECFRIPKPYFWGDNYTKTITCKESHKTLRYIRVECSGRLVLHRVKIYGWPTNF